MVFARNAATPSCPPTRLLSEDPATTHQSLDVTTHSKVQSYLQHMIKGAGAKVTL